MRPMTMTDGTRLLMMSKVRLLIQYAGMDMPEIICMCFRFFSRSFRMKEMTTAGTSAKPMETTKAIKMPLADEALCFSFSVTGNEVVTVWKLKFGIPSACLRIAS